MRTFRLLKDISTPVSTIPAGSLFTKEQEGCAYRNRVLDEAYHSAYVENNPTWFEEVHRVVPMERKWTDADLLDLTQFVISKFYSQGRQSDAVVILAKWLEIKERLNKHFPK